MTGAGGEKSKLPHRHAQWPALRADIPRVASLAQHGNIGLLLSLKSPELELRRTPVFFQADNRGPLFHPTHCSDAVHSTSHAPLSETLTQIA